MPPLGVELTQTPRDPEDEAPAADTGEEDDEGCSQRGAERPNLVANARAQTIGANTSSDAISWRATMPPLSCAMRMENTPTSILAVMMPMLSASTTRAVRTAMPVYGRSGTGLKRGDLEQVAKQRDQRNKS